jgi:inosine-uridine nucleoside N-ribohydrolase
MGPDSDDAGALAVLHALEASGEARILATLCSTTDAWCAPCVDAINTYYERGSIQVGTLKGRGSPGGTAEWTANAFNAYIAGHFPNQLQHGTHAPSALELYRKILSSQPDSSVHVVATGPLTNLANLLEWQAENGDGPGGLDLVSRKVRELTVMGGMYPTGSEFNFRSDSVSARIVLDTWPTPIMFSGFELGAGLKTGARLFDELAEEHPVRLAYHLWDLQFARWFAPSFDMSKGIWPHSSFDQTAVLYAVRGLRDYWFAETTGGNTITTNGANAWQSAPDRPHAYLIEHMPRDQLTRIIEDLMVYQP